MTRKEFDQWLIDVNVRAQIAFALTMILMVLTLIALKLFLWK